MEIFQHTPKNTMTPNYGPPVRSANWMAKNPAMKGAAHTPNHKGFGECAPNCSACATDKTKYLSDTEQLQNAVKREFDGPEIITNRLY